MACFQSSSLSLHYTTGGRKSGVLLHEFPNNGLKCPLPGGIAAKKRQPTQKGTAAQRCAAVPFCVGWRFFAAMPPGKGHFKPLLGNSCKSTPLFLPPVV